MTQSNIDANFIKIKYKAFARFDSKGQVIKYNNKHTCIDEKNLKCY